MKRLLLSLLLVAALPVLSFAEEDKEKPWLDMQGCSICKHMGEHMDMMEHVKWETHKIATGMLSASVIPKEYRAKMKEIHEKMQGVIAQLEKGKEMPLCGFCTSYGELKMAGAKSEDITTEFGMIGLLTSEDPEVIKKIHAHTDRTVKEFKKFLAAQGQ